MSSSLAVTELQVEAFSFPAEVNPPASTNTLFLAGAGVRGLEIGGNFVKVTTIGVYLEDKALSFLSGKWKGKSGLELNDSVEFFRDIVTGPFEKFIRVTVILPLTGQEFSEKVAENCIAIWKSLGVHTDAEAKAIEKFLHAFRDVNILPGSSVLYTQLPRGSLAISFAKHDSVPEVSSVIIDNKLLSEALLESIIGKHGVSPNTRLSVATRMSDLLNESHCNGHESGKRLTMSSSPAVTELQVETFSFPAFVKPPASNKTLFLGGAGMRGLEIQGKFVKATAIGVYLEDETVPFLATKWKGKSAEELNDSIEFFREVVTAPFEKCVRITMILPLSGQQFSEKVTENCVAIWKSLGIYTDVESKAIEQFLEVFKDENFASGSSILYTQLWQGFLAISFAKHDSVPEIANIVIENKLLSEAILESIIGKHGVSPASRRSLATRLSKLLKESHENGC